MPSGQLRERMQLNFDRMDSDRFAPVMKTGCLQGPNYAWPGDMEGRSLLAFVLLERATGRASANLAGLRAAWPGELNPHGYFGKPLDPQAINEQQLSSHGWVLRGLGELYEWRQEPQVLDEIRLMARNLALPTRGAHAVYPIDPAERRKGVGSFVGEHAQRVGRWLLSSDVGCDLIFMDGLMHAATLLNDPEVDALCEEILARNLEIDLLTIQAQTHATLTGLRGMLRWAAHKGRPALVTEAESRFRLYLAEAMTENGENWNWFGRPTHTEPCAVVDSLMVANELWRLTGKADYLAWAHRITLNGFFAEQVFRLRAPTARGAWAFPRAALRRGGAAPCARPRAWPISRAAPCTPTARTSMSPAFGRAGSTCRSRGAGWRPPWPAATRPKGAGNFASRRRRRRRSGSVFSRRRGPSARA
jgi:hypothetical protein